MAAGARDTVRHVDIITGCFLLIPRGMWRTLGMDLTKASSCTLKRPICASERRNWASRPMFTPSAVIVHYGGASETVTVRENRYVFLPAKVTFLRKHWPLLSDAALAVNLYKLLALIRALGYSAAGMFTRSEKRRAKGREWRTVWSIGAASGRRGMSSHRPKACRPKVGTSFRKKGHASTRGKAMARIRNDHDML